MSVYQLLPSPSLAVGENNFSTWENGFTDEQLKRICEIGDSLELSFASIADGIVDNSVRMTKTGWIELNNETMFIYDTLGFIARQLNGQFFDFDLFGFAEDLQYTVYNDNGDKYDWHLDRGISTSAPRKLSLVLQLSDPSEYEGGDLELYIGPEPVVVTKQLGLVTAFPSFVLHRVTPVTKGTRKTLVVWLSGPRFR
jgi:PKHD-type hydroxylase